MDERNLTEPAFDIHVEELRQIGRGSVQPAHIEILRTRQSPDRSIDRIRRPVASFKDPFQYAAVFPVTRPQELTFLVFAKPVHDENLRHLCAWSRTDFEPVRKVTSHVIAAEWQHGHGIAAQLSHFYTFCSTRRADGANDHSRAWS